MSVRDVEHTLEPASATLIGANARPDSTGAVIARNLLRLGFAGSGHPCPEVHVGCTGLRTAQATHDQGRAAVPERACRGLACWRSRRHGRGHDAAFRPAETLQVRDMQGVFDAAETRRSRRTRQLRPCALNGGPRPVGPNGTLGADSKRPTRPRRLLSPLR